MKKITLAKTVTVGAGNIFSQVFFLWVFRFILILRRAKDLKNLILVLRKTETSDYNDELLEKKWSEEKERAYSKKKQPIIRRALFKAFGLNFILNGIFKILWGLALWFGAYWLLKVTIQYVRCVGNPKKFSCSFPNDQLTGHMFALGFLISSVLATIFIQQLLSQSGRLGLRVI
jgi:hypothetical protein